MLQWNKIQILPPSSVFYRKNKTFCPVVGAYALIKGYFFIMKIKTDKVIYQLSVSTICGACAKLYHSDFKCVILDLYFDFI